MALVFVLENMEYERAAMNLKRSDISTLVFLMLDLMPRPENPKAAWLFIGSWVYLGP